MDELTIQSGSCYAIFAYDAARSINLDLAERRIHEATQRQTIKQKRRAPSYFEYQPLPLRVSQEVEPLHLGNYVGSSIVDLVVYDFGAISVIYNFPIEGPLAQLRGLSEELYGNESLLNDSRIRIDYILKMVGDAASQSGIADVVEDYLIFSVDAFNPVLHADRLCELHGHDIAQILRAEQQPLSKQEIGEALGARISYGTEDLIIADWNAALVVDADGEDVRSVLEFANVELLEMRYLDHRLDRALEQAYEMLSRRSWRSAGIFRSYAADLRKVAELEVDNATLFEGVNNTLKLIGDQYLARVYRLANRRFHLDDWDGSILRKLQTLHSIYEITASQATNRRMEILEWVIIVLIAFSVIIEILPRLH
ncbi:MAG TPA: hypothetical protein VIB79_28590 [Candidatus Binatia bacterium]